MMRYEQESFLAAHSSVGTVLTAGRDQDGQHMAMQSTHGDAVNAW